VELFFSHKDAYPLLAVVGVILGIVVTVVANLWYKMRRVEMEISLKQAMVERGMSAPEICAVIEAGRREKPELDREERAKTGFKVRA
jgi:hypothetical protein